MKQLTLSLAEPTATAKPLHTTLSRYRLSIVREATLPYNLEYSLTSAQAIVGFLWQEIFHDRPQEVMAVLHTDTKCRLIGVQVAYVGTLSSTTITPREILASVLTSNAAGFFLAHNHPSEDPSPSVGDLDLTRQIHQGAKWLGLKFLDHLIIGGENSWVSLQARGGW